jgi:hypothetical protein
MSKFLLTALSFALGGTVGAMVAMCSVLLIVACYGGITAAVAYFGTDIVVAVIVLVGALIGGLWNVSQS